MNACRCWSPTRCRAAEPDGDPPVTDERLRMLFACCHPALPPDARAAMMLRFVAGLTTAEIARLFLVPEADDGGPADPGQAQDGAGRHPVAHARRGGSAGPARRGAQGRLPAFHRGLPRHRRPGADPAAVVGGGDPAGLSARRVAARRGPHRWPCSR